jgi:hypothetical protein
MDHLLAPKTQVGKSNARLEQTRVPYDDRNVGLDDYWDSLNRSIDRFDRKAVEKMTKDSESWS